LLAILFFIANLFPVLGFFDLSSFVFSFVEDHFQYHASIGLIALSSGILTRFLKLSDSLQFSKAGVKFLIPLVIITTLGTTTWRYALLFRDEVFLWEDTLRKNPEAALAHFNLGVIYQRRGHSEDAEPHYRKTIQLEPTHAIARNNLAVILTAQGKLDEAAGHLMSVLKTYPADVSAHTNLGIVLAREGKHQEAIHHFALAVRLEPQSDEGLHNLTTAFRMKEDPSAQIGLVQSAAG
jgi:tetratricopeptide (TPR) repeat protein